MSKITIVDEKSKMKDKEEKLFTIGAISSLVIGILLVAFFIWANIMFGREAKAEGADISTINIQKNTVKLTLIYAGMAVLTFFRVVQSSYTNYKQNHIQRGLIYGISSFIGNQFYYAELSDKIYKETTHDNEKWYEKRKPLYGALAIILFVLMIIGVL